VLTNEVERLTNALTQATKSLDKVEEDLWDTEFGMELFTLSMSEDSRKCGLKSFGVQ